MEYICNKYALDNCTTMLFKPAGASCNLDCDYCYYISKAALYGSGAHVMDDAVLERAVRSYLESQAGPEVYFTWHGGEPLLRPLSFYRKAVELQRRYAGGMAVHNCLQTNGTLLDEEWCRFLRDEGWLVGVSLDGPPRFHDAYRRDRSGRPSFDRVLRGIGLMERFGVQWNAMAVVNDANCRRPAETYRFFRSIGCRFLQFTPVTERFAGKGTGRRLAMAGEQDAVAADFSVDAEGWGEFLCGVFDEWVRSDVGRLFVQIFDATLANWAGVPPSLCSMAGECVREGVMEYNGDVYCCDHFVFGEFRLGNVMEQDLASLVYGRRQDEFVRSKTGNLTRQCRECPFLFACNGDCPRNRYGVSIYGEIGHSVLCDGFRRYFDHVSPYMDFMKGELLARRAPANVMDLVL